MSPNPIIVTIIIFVVIIIIVVVIIVITLMLLNIIIIVIVSVVITPCESSYERERSHEDVYRAVQSAAAIHASTPLQEG